MTVSFKQGLMLAGASFAVGQPALAQTAAPPATSDAAIAAVKNDNDGVAEIVVTAQRRAENLTSVPLSISAITSEGLKATGIKDIASLAQITPGFVTADGVGYTQVYIRGVGNSIYVGADPSVATFIDDTPRIYGSMVNNLVNVERVEVLKGAQGGLYGRNATGGVINIITRQPSDKSEVRGRIAYGTHNTLDASAYVNVPLSDRIAMNVSGLRQTHDPYVRNLAPPTSPYPAGTLIVNPYTGDVLGDANASYRPGKMNDQDFWAVDSKIRVRLTDNLKVTFAADYANKDDNNSNGWKQVQPEVAYGTYAFLATLHLGPTGYVPGGFLRCPDGTSTSCLPTSFPSPPKGFQSYSPSDAYATIKDYGVSAKAELNLDGVDLTSISSFRWNKTGYFNDSGATIVPVISYTVDNTKHNFYQELRAVSSGTGPLQFLAGATYLKDHVKGRTVVYYLGAPATAPTSPMTDTEGYSVYAQLSYALTSRMKLTASVRYVHETKKVVFGDLPGAVRASGSNNKLLPSATLSYAVDGGTLYARYAKGYKTGGINPVVDPSFFPGGIGSTFGPEEVDTYEAGYRAQLFDRAVQFTSAVFYNKYKNLQVNAAGSPSHPEIAIGILNAKAARTYGAEASLTWRVAKPLTLALNAGYLNAKYTDFVIPGEPFTPQNNNGNTMIYSPKFQGSATINYDQPINDRLRIIANGLLTHSSRVDFDLRNRDIGAQKAYSVVNGRVGVAAIDDRFRVYAYVNNLFNKYYATYAAINDSLGIQKTPGERRIIGAALEFKF